LFIKKGEVKADGRRQAAGQREPANKRSEQERQQILETANSPEFAALAPSQIVPALANLGAVASESTVYRILREADRLARPGKAKPPARQHPRLLQASAPTRLWSWDITYLATTVKGLFFCLYLIEAAPGRAADSTKLGLVPPSANPFYSFPRA